MANGDIAALYGFTPIAPTDDIRLGYDRINQLADLLATRTGANAWSLAPITPATGFGTLTDPAGATSGTLAGGVKLAGGLLIGSFALTYTGTTLTAGANGNLTDTKAATLAAGYRPSGGRYVSFSAGVSTSLGEAHIGSDGNLYLYTLDPTGSIASGTVLNFDFVVPM